VKTDGRYKALGLLFFLDSI